MPDRSTTRVAPKAALRTLKARAGDAAALLRAMANEQRLLILCNLQNGPLTVSELNERIDLSQSALSQHLAVLRESGIVTTTRDAQSITYALPKGAVTRVIAILYEEFCAG